MFTGEVDMCREVEVMLEESDSELVDSDSDKFRTAVKFHLAGLVVQTECRLPFSYYGVQLTLGVRVCMGVEDRDLSRVMDKLHLDTDLPTSPGLDTSLLDTTKISTAATSTPHKTPNSTSPTCSPAPPLSTAFPPVSAWFSLTPLSRPSPPP